MAGQKGEIGINVFIGLSLLLVGILSSIIAFMGFVLKDTRFIWVGSIIFGAIALIVTILERFVK